MPNISYLENIITPTKYNIFKDNNNDLKILKNVMFNMLLKNEKINETTPAPINVPDIKYTPAPVSVPDIKYTPAPVNVPDIKYTPTPVNVPDIKYTYSIKCARYKIYTCSNKFSKYTCSIKCTN